MKELGIGKEEAPEPAPLDLALRQPRRRSDDGTPADAADGLQEEDRGRLPLPAPARD